MRIGVDIGGTKIEAAALDARGGFLARRREPTPRGDYDGVIAAVRRLVERVEAETGAAGAVGVGAPGSVSPRTGLVRNANSVWLNGRRLRDDLAAALGRQVRVANDANCLALSEAKDGAAEGAGVVFAAILGTGCGGGIVVDGTLIEGANAIAGEWGHTPLPWPTPEEAAGPRCWCGRAGCLETWISGPGFAHDYERATGQALEAPAIVAAARGGEAAAEAALARFIDRLGRALAMVADILDPDVIVLGGGLSNIGEIYERAPAVVTRHVFADGWDSRIAPARWGDSSGVRGAARLWPDEAADGPAAPLVHQRLAAGRR
ncbi:MAG: ROK family protein [Caulobacterales bacterium]|nr:ROK family protein [Caulobacterales bacterium]